MYAAYGIMRKVLLVRKHSTLLGLLLAAGSLMACSGMMAEQEGIGRSSVTTVPYDAACELVGASGEKVGGIAPGHNLGPREFKFDVQIPPKERAFFLVCHKEGYPRARIPLGMERDDAGRNVYAASGNMLLFGLIGGVLISLIEERGGAMSRYSPHHYVILVPGKFESAKARDDFFHQEVERIMDMESDISEKIRASCTWEEEVCGKGIQSIRDRRNRILLALEQARVQR